MNSKLPELKELPQATIAVVGGTHLNDYLAVTNCLTGYAFVETAAGVSPKIYFGVCAGVPFYYVHFHGEGKWLETWLALRDLGVTNALGGATAGGINPLLKPRDFLIPSDFLDHNIDRIANVPVEHLADPSHALCRFVPAFDETLRTLLIEESRAVIRELPELADVNVFAEGVVLQSRFGRFETVAEINAYRLQGADVVTHNLTTEIVFAKQLGIHYAALHVVSNPAEGVAPWSFESLSDIYLQLNPVSWQIFERVLPRIAAISPTASRTLDGQREHPPLSYVELTETSNTLTQ